MGVVMKKNLVPLLAFFICVMLGEQLLFNSSLVTGAVRSSMELCVTTVIPSLFCFMVLSAFLSGSGLGKILSLPLLPLMRWLNLPASCGSIVLMSLIGGYPSGIKGIRDAYVSKQLDESTAKRLCLFCICPAPSFVIVALGERLLGNRDLGILLYLAQVGAVILLAAGSACFSGKQNKQERIHFLKKSSPKSLSEALVDAVRFSCETLLYMCGFVTLFGVFSAILGQLPFSAEQHSILSAAMEITAGSKLLAETASPFRLILLSFFLSFGGLSALFQLKSILRDVPCSMGRLLWGRLLHGGLAVTLFQLLLRCFPQVMDVLANGVQPLPLHNSSTPILCGCLIGMMLILLNSIGEKTKAENK